MLLIYTHKITPRFTYIMKHMFENILGIQIDFTVKVESFIKHNGPKITYAKQPLQNEFFIRSNDLLFEQGISDIQINIGDWNGIPCFFPAGERSNIPFDVFAASFFLISRYEEYLPHVKDVYGRFSPKDSIAYQNNFLDKPVVNLWAQELLSSLKERFKEIVQNPSAYKYISVIDVTTSHCYANRGMVRGVMGLLIDMSRFKLKRVIERIAVAVNKLKDPYDNFEKLIELQKKFGLKNNFFFQFADYSKYDKNVSVHNNNFRSLIKFVADYAPVSLAASYSSFGNEAVLKKEKKGLEEVINMPVNNSKMRYNRVDVPVSYRNLVAAEFTDDYTMGYTHELGFRAGTCTSFQFYDIPLEVKQPIKIHPFAVHDYALLKLKKQGDILERVATLANEIKQVNGTFITIFSNEILGSRGSLDWISIYTKIVSKHYV